MIQKLLKIINSELMYYVAIPLIILFLNWIKSVIDIKGKNKELGYWKMKYRKIHTFRDIVMKIYIYMTINLFVMYCLTKVFSLTENRNSIYVFLWSIYIIINTLIVFTVCKSAKTKTEMLSNKKIKIILVIAIYIIFESAFLEYFYTELKIYIDIAVGIALTVWIFFLYKYSDSVYVLDNQYADIYIKGSEKAEFAIAGNMKKKGDWVIVHKYVNGYLEEIRIKEDDIVRIDYYGGPIIIVN